ncbi:7020_t:CDS:2, partial [Funneliformis geosporum]
ETFDIMKEILLYDPTYFTLDCDWSLLSFLLYQQQCDDFTANKCVEYKRYIRNLSAIIEIEDLSETTYDLAYVTLNAVQQEKKLELIDDFWTNAISAQKWKIEALSERSALVEELTTTTNVTRQLADMKGDHSLLNKRPSMIQKEDSAKECTTQEDLLNSIIETSNIFEKVPSYYDKLKTIWHA